MHLIRFKCKRTGRVFQEVKNDLASCDKCAFRLSRCQDEYGEAQTALFDHCLSVSCIPRGTHFVEVTA